MNVLLPDDLADLVKTKVGSGRYASPGDVVREALHLMERVEQQNAEKLARLRDLWVGIAQVNPVAADRVIERIEAACAHLCHPGQAKHRSRTQGPSSSTANVSLAAPGSRVLAELAPG